MVQCKTDSRDRERGSLRSAVATCVRACVRMCVAYVRANHDTRKPHTRARDVPNLNLNLNPATAPPATIVTRQDSALPRGALERVITLSSSARPFTRYARKSEASIRCENGIRC